jgi:hypothetical protein
MEDDIEQMFDFLLRTVSPRSTFRLFVEDVHHWWQTRGFLTNAQYNALKRAMQRTRE